MAFKLKGGVGGPMQKNFPSAFKHFISMRKEDQHKHPHEEEEEQITPANPNSDFVELGRQYEEFEKRSDDRSLVGKVLGQTAEQDKERSESSENIKDAAQVGLSLAGVGNPVFDAFNAGGSVGRAIDAAIGISRPQSWSDAWKNTKGAGYNLAAIAPVAGDAVAVKRAMDFKKGATELGRSLTFQGDKISDAVRSVGNVGYWFDEDTGTAPTIVDKTKGAFKLGNNSLPGIGTGGSVNKKHGFTVKHKDLEEGVVAEATSANEVVINNSVPKGSKLYNKALAHEGLHAKEMADGKIEYGDDFVRDGNKTYHRKDGQIKYNGKWLDEGDSKFPWEKRAKNAEKT